MLIKEYINKLIIQFFFRGELEISIYSQIYDVNIATYKENDNRRLSAIRYYNNNRDQNRHLLILNNINDNHFRFGYYRPNSMLDFNYIIPSNIYNNDAGEVENIQDNYNKEKLIIEKSFNYLNIIKTINKFKILKWFDLYKIPIMI